MSELYAGNGTIKRTVTYLKSHFRRPVSIRPPLGLVDYQALCPPSWCPRCGKELYHDTCVCSEEKGAMCDV